MNSLFMKWSGIIILAFNFVAMRDLIPDRTTFYFQAIPVLFSLVVGGILLYRGITEKEKNEIKL